jgi:alcohol dehydrogenase
MRTIMTTLVAEAPIQKTNVRTIMTALVYQGPGRKALEERPMPKITAPTDAIVKVTKTTICGTDLHILKGDVPTCKPGRILGHEGVGVVDALAPAWPRFARVIAC